MTTLPKSTVQNLTDRGFQRPADKQRKRADNRNRSGDGNGQPRPSEDDAQRGKRGRGRRDDIRYDQCALEGQLPSREGPGACSRRTGGV